MIPNHTVNDVVTSEVQMSGVFGISSENTAHIMSILRDTLYSDKILAVLREYGSNAWDAHRDAGIPNEPINVHLPTALEPYLAIRDFGLGLSQGDVFSIYTQYGASTKRSSDNSVGMLGIGSKSAFAYADSFTITSWYGGMKRIYVAALDPSNKGIIDQIHEEPSDERTGVEIQVAVRQDDLDDFHERATSLFQHFTPRPTLNVDLSDAFDLSDAPGNAFILPEGSLYHSVHNADEWVAVMGCIPYRINLMQLGDRLPYFLRNRGGVVRLAIGEAHISASREELKYTDETKNVLVQRITALIDAVISKISAEVEAQAVTPWEKRLKLRALLDVVGYMYPKSEEAWQEEYASLKAPPTPEITAPDGTILPGKPVPWPRFVYVKQDIASRIRVAHDTIVFIRDTTKTLTGYKLPYAAVLVSEDELPLVDTAFALRRITGVPMRRLSTLEWTPSRPGRRNRQGGSIKHRKDCFVWQGTARRAPLSDNWIPLTTETPSPASLWVVLNSFDPKGVELSTTVLLQRAYTALGLPMPTVFGYKSTEKKPVDETKLLGSSLALEQPKMVADLLTKYAAERQQWYRARAVAYAADLNEKQTPPEILRLPVTHPVRLFFDEAFATMPRLLEVGGLGADLLNILENLDPTGSQGEDREDVKDAFVKVIEPYPLLKRAARYRDTPSFDNSTLVTQYVDYILAMDHKCPSNSP